MRLATYSMLALFLAAVLQARPDFDTKKIEGTYSIVSGQRNGKPLPEAEIKGALVTFTADRITSTDKERKEMYAATYKIDESSSPPTIRMESIAPKKGEKAQGVIEIKGDTVRLSYNLPGGEAPKEFKAGEKQHFFVLKKVK